MLRLLEVPLQVEFSWVSGAPKEPRGMCTQHVVILSPCVREPRNPEMLIQAYCYPQLARWRLLVRPIPGKPRSNLPQRSLRVICPPISVLWCRSRSSTSSSVRPPNGSSPGWRVIGSSFLCNERNHSWLCWGADEPVEMPGLWNRKARYDM